MDKILYNRFAQKFEVEFINYVIEILVHPRLLLPWQCPPGGNLNPQYPGTHSSHCRPNTLSLQLHCPRMTSVPLVSLLQSPLSVIPTEKQSQAVGERKMSNDHKKMQQNCTRSFSFCTYISRYKASGPGYVI